MLRTAITLILLLPLFWYGGLFAWKFYSETGTVWQRFLAAGKDSATIAWAQLVIVGAGLMNGIGAIAAAVSDQGTSDQIKAAIPPEYAAGGLVVIMALVIIARLRTLEKDV